MLFCCPHCHESSELGDSQPSEALVCNHCGGEFRILAEETVSRRPHLGPQLEHFDLLEQVGVGAFGSVWRAQDRRLSRTVAVKIPRQGRLDPKDNERFLREARAAAQVRHPNIVTVHEIGQAEDSIYIVADFVDGPTLADWLTAHRFTSRKAALMCQQIADALHAAHEAGVVHRDLKPGNVLLDEEQQPYITDFGLAKNETIEVTMTQDGHTLGTPAYMSPEQAEGKSHAVDRRSDIYSLGVILFELMTGERPFRGNARMLLHQVLRDEPPKPRKLDGSIPLDLETICLKCMEKSPDRRYATAQEVSQELQRFLNGEPIEARPIGPLARAWRTCKRNPMVSGLAACLALTIVSGLVATSVLWLSERRVTKQQADQLYRSRTNQAFIAFNDGDQNSFDVSMNELRQLTSVTDRGIEWDFLIAREKEMEPDGSLSAPRTILRVTHASDGRLIVACEDGSNHIAGLDGQLKDFTLVQDYTAAATPAGNYITSNGTRDDQTEPPSGTKRIWSYPQLESIDQLPLPKINERVTFSPTERLVAIGGKEGRLRVHTVEDGSLVTPPLDTPSYRCAFSNDDQLLANVTGSHSIELWDLPSGIILDRVGDDISVASGEVGFSPDNRFVALCGHHGARIWRIAENKLARLDWRLDTEAYDFSFSPEGYLAIGCSDQSVKIWHVDDLDNQIANLVNPSMVTSVAFSPDGKRLAAGCRGGTIQIWESPRWNAPRLATSDAHYHPPFDVSRDQVALISEPRSSGRDQIYLVHRATGIRSPLSPEFSSDVHAAAFSDNAQYVSAIDINGDVRVWDVHSKQLVLRSNVGKGYSVAFSIDGAFAAGGGNKVRVWNSVENADVYQDIGALQPHVASLCFSRLGHLAIGSGTSPSGPGKIQFVDFQQQNLAVPAPISTPECVRDITFSEDGKLVAYMHSFSNGKVEVLDTQTWKPLWNRLSCHSGKSTQLAFVGNRLITGSDNSVVAFWDVANAELLGSLKVGAKVREIKLVPGGKTFATVTRRGAVRFWDY